MRDIRDDLLERKAVLEKEIQSLKAQLQHIDGLLEAESSRWTNGNQHPLPLKAPHHSLNTAHLNEFLQDLLKDGKPRTTEEIRDIVVKQGFDFEGKAPGRSINFRLVGLQRFGYVQKNEANGTWTTGK